MSRRENDLYEQHAQSVYRYLFSLSRETDIAEELTQETFYQAMKNLDSFRGDSSPLVWLCAIAKRLWFKELERRKRTVPDDQEVLAQAAAPDDPAGEYEEKEQRLLLYQAIQKLDPQTREVIYLRLSGDFSFGEIGSLLGHSEVWARVRFYRGKEELMKLLGGGKHDRQ